MSKRNGSSSKVSGRGRKPKYENRATHNVSLSEAAWKGLQIISKQFGLRYRSELIEKIGTNEIKLKNQDSFDESLSDSPFAFEFDMNTHVPIRIVSIYKAKNPLLRSITAAIYRYINQLGLEEGIDPKQRTRLMCETLLKTARVIELLKHLKPEYAPRSLSALIVWVSYQILYTKKVKQKVNKDSANSNSYKSGLNSEKVEIGLWKIGYSLSKLKWVYPQSFRLLNLRFRHGKDYYLVAEYLNARGQRNGNGQIYSRSTAQEESATSRLYLRKIFHEIENDNILKDYMEADDRDRPIEDIGGYPSRINRYYELAALESVDENDHKEISSILQEASVNLYLDFWINEVDHSIGHDLKIIEKWLYKTSELVDDIANYEISYSDYEKEELESLETAVKDEIISLREELNRKYSLIRVEEFTNIICEMILEVGDIDIYSWLHSVCTYELKMLDDLSNSFNLKD